MPKHINLLFSYLAMPKQTVRDIKQTNILLPSIITFIIAVFTQSLISQIVLIISNRESLMATILVFLLSFTIYSLMIITYLALIQFIVSFFCKEIDTKTVLSISCLSFTPIFLLLPVSIVSTFWISQSTLLLGLASFLTFLWITVLFFSGIKEAYSLNFWQFILVIFSPVFLGILFLAIFVLAVVYFMLF